ncbi:MAG: DUF3303 family protein [Bryobacteraceae bacterium]|nr:DUF3303 family protein [Bryobacteraceae bacterium]
MRFVIHYTLGNAQRDAAQRRFAETGGAPPEGVTMIERYHCAQGLEGFLICESNSAAALAQWMQNWTDLLTFRILPVVDDQTLSQIIGG